MADSGPSKRRVKNQADYIPGVCNINVGEVAYRRKWRNIGLLTSIVILIMLLVTGAPAITRLVIFLPLFIGVIGYYQTKHRFCVGYGASGLQNASEGSIKASRVNDDQARVDKVFARKLNTKAAVISSILTILSLAIPS